jgi:hypothetical protein
MQYSCNSYALSSLICNKHTMKTLIQMIYSATEK